MTYIAVAITIAGIALAVGIGVKSEFDVLSAVLGTSVLAAGLLVIAVVRRGRSGAVAPARCPDCGGLLSPSSPYCKHCGARLQEGTEGSSP